MRSQQAQARIDEEQRAIPFRCTREAHHTEIAEDYVELIAELIDTSGEARGADIARRLGVTQATVANTVARLQRSGLVTFAPYRSIFLTEEGRALAERCRRRHEVVLAFLRSIGVSEEEARRDAEGIEHHVGNETLAAFERLTQAAGYERS
jgi:DtxR family transcriptional regulator, manganese transport regulator